MMDYEFQPANHLSFRLAERVVVPEVFPIRQLSRFGARSSKVSTYAGFKEELYLAGFRPNRAVLDGLGVDDSQVLAVLRPPPTGALYHRGNNPRFDQILDEARMRPDVQTVFLGRTREHVTRRDGSNLIVPAASVDGQSLLALADLLVGAGGTMNREGALLGTPTYSVFAGKLAAVDKELIRNGALVDLRDSGSPQFSKKPLRELPAVPQARRDVVMDAILNALIEISGRPRER
jgi:predicted glycosyltransferase